MTGEYEVAGRRVVVVGGARSGCAAALLLAGRGARVTVADTRGVLPDADRLRAAGVALQLGGYGAAALAAADLVVLSPGVPPVQPAIDAARRAGVPVIGELELASRWLKGRIVAITGTKGKSTTTALAGRMLQAGGVPALMGGNIGDALSAQVEQSRPEVIHVVEASSFQLETVDTFHPWVAVLLNFSPDHLDRHAGLEAYAAAKARIFENQGPADWAVVNADDPAAVELAARGRARQLRFAVDAPLAEGIVVAGGAIAHRVGDQAAPLVPLAAVRLLGRHLLSDVLAATAVAAIAGVPAEAMTRAVEAFSGLEHALEPVAEIEGVRFVNDSKATNVEAAKRAIESFERGVVVILGGRFKGGDLAALREPLRSRGAAAVTIGEARPLIGEALQGVLPIHQAESLPAAVRTAFGLAPPGGVVLLAPACASFDMFEDYAARGRAFRQAAARLKEEIGGRREG